MCDQPTRAVENENWLPKNTVFQLFLSRFLNVSGAREQATPCASRQLIGKACLGLLERAATCLEVRWQRFSEVSYFQHILFEQDVPALVEYC